jgi:hypothetical protein
MGVEKILHHDKHTMGIGLVSTANINTNAITRDLHCEKDTTCTTICVPKKKTKNTYDIPIQT